MPENELSISDVYEQGLEQQPEGTPDGSSNEDGDTPPETDGEGEDEPDPNGTGEGEPDGENDEDGSQEKKDPIIDPEKGIYEGEYTKDRFDGLMGQWQKDRGEALKIPDLLRQIDDLKGQLAGGQPPKPQAQGDSADEFDLPPELAKADEETKAGFKTIMGAVAKHVQNSRSEIIGEVVKMLNKPVEEQNRVATQVNREVEELSAEFGKSFTNNKQEIIKFAVERKYPLGTLRQATEAFLEIQRLKRGKDAVNDYKKEKEKEAELPGNTKTRTNVMRQYDPEKDAGKSYGDLLREGLE